MKRIPILSVLLTLSILAGFLFFFPLEWVLLLVTMVALVTAQVIVLRRHLHVVGNTGRRRHSTVDLGKVVRESQAPQVPAAEGSGSGDGAAPPFDPAVFSRFRAHLDAAEGGLQGSSPPAAEAEAEAEAGVEAAAADGENLGGDPAQSPAEHDLLGEKGEEGEVRVVLSPAARSKAAAARPPSQHPQPPEGGGDRAVDKAEDLFADLRTEPPKPKGKPVKKGQKGIAGTAKPDLESISPEEGEQEKAADKVRNGGEREMLLKLAEDALEKGDRAGAAAGLEQVLRLHDEAQQPLPWRVRLAQARLAVLQGNHTLAIENFEELLKWRPRLEETEYVAQIDQLTSPVSGASGAELRVSMLLKLLAVFRQVSDRTAMDRIYVLIESAQEQSGDEQKLIQYYKNHLEIKTVMDDVEGQLGLIDQIGNRYYKLGDTEAARKFYEQGLKLREAQEAASEEAGTASP